MKCRLRSDHLKGGSAMIGETLVKFDADGISEEISPAAARCAMGVPGVDLHEGDITARAEEKLEGVVNLTIEVAEADGTPRGKFTKTGKIGDLFPDGNGVMVVKLEALKAKAETPAKDDKDKKPDATATNNGK